MKIVKSDKERVRMPRPSLKEERREQILLAFEACVARYGVEGATLEKIAEEAGLARALIRHNVGNKDDLLEALIERFLANSKAASVQMFAALPTQGAVSTLIDGLFDPAYSNPQLVLVSEALIAASADNPALARKMRKWTTDFVSGIERVLAREYPDADEDTLKAVAAGLTGLYFNVESLSPLGGIKSLTSASKAAALILIGALGD